MARTIETIQQQIIATKETYPELASANSTSRRAIWRLWTYVQAVAINVFEQLQDVFQTALEAIIAQAAPATPAWIAAQALKFQYSAANPQVIQLVNTVPQYATVDPTLRIVTRCSVKTTLSGQVQVKVAKGDPPGPLSSPERSALQNYINTIGIAGVNYLVVSGAADRLYIAANVYYQGQYSALIQSNVEAAVAAFLASVPFDGSVRISDLEQAIRSAEGVNDLVFIDIKARQSTVAFSSATDIILNQTQISRLWSTIAGYIIPEDDTGHTLADSLNYIAE